MKPNIPLTVATFALLAGCATPPDTQRGAHGFTSTPISRDSAAARKPAPAVICTAEPVAKEIEPFIPFGTLDEHLKSIKLTNGIGPGEAAILATAYFTRYDGLCGAVCSLRRDPTAWRAFTVFGYGGVPGDDIFIDIHNGAIAQRGHPLIHPPWSELRLIEETYNERMAPVSDHAPAPP